MMWRTHAFLGVSSLWLLAPLPNVLTTETVGPLCALAAFGALLPDLDAERSKIRSLQFGGIRPFVPLSSLAYKAWGHRTLLHSPLGLLVFGLLCLPCALLWGLAPASALWLGYASHLLGDACTRTGIPAWPNRTDRRWWFLPPRLRLVTGSMEEDALLLPLAALVMLLLLTHYPAL